MYCNPLNYKKSEQQCNVKHSCPFLVSRCCCSYSILARPRIILFFKVATFMQLFPHHAQLSKSLCDVILGPISFMEHEKTKQFDAFYWVQKQASNENASVVFMPAMPHSQFTFSKRLFFHLTLFFWKPINLTKVQLKRKRIRP